MRMSNFDRWLTTDTFAEQQQADAERLADAWYTFAADRKLPDDCIEDDSPDHAIYVAWEALESAIDARQNAIDAEAEAKMYAEAEAAEERWEAMMRRSPD